MRKYPKYAALVFAIILIASTGFYREFFFVNVNEQLRFLWYGNEESLMSDALSFLSALDYWSLYYLKWIMTVVFSVIFMLESCLITKLILGKPHWREFIFIYGLLTAISGVIFTCYALFGNTNTGYLISRYFMGIAQSPIPLMVFLSAIHLRKRFGSNH